MADLDSTWAHAKLIALSSRVGEAFLYAMAHPTSSCFERFRMAMKLEVAILLTTVSATCLCWSCSRRTPNTAEAQPAAPMIFFDDFSYASRDGLESNGWIVRTVSGWPGIPGAVWSSENVSFLDDPVRPGNRVMRMTSMIAETVRQTQVCQQRKFFEGTYAARVRFTNFPVEGRSGDELVQSFYAITPYRQPLDPAYSEIDFEYLPGGGWGNAPRTLVTTTWDTTQMEPPKDLNAISARPGDYAGWHTLVFQAVGGEVSYYADCKLLAQHHKPNYPDAPMSLNFNLWFIKRSETLPKSEPRRYVEDVDWVFYAKDVLIASKDIAQIIDGLRAQSALFRDTVPSANPPLASPCDL